MTRLASHPVIEVPATPRLGDSPVVQHQGRTYRLFFLCGHPRSGTNWMGALLNLHPAIVCRGEYRFEALRQGFDRLEKHWWHVAHEEPVRLEAERCFRETICRVMLASLYHNPGATWIGDRTPRQLAPHIPGAPHVYIVRDPRDVIVSWTYREVRGKGAAAAAGPHAAEMMALSAQFDADISLFQKHPERLLSCEKWVRFAADRFARHVGGDLVTLARARAGEIDMPVHEVRYERLHQDFAGERARLYGFFGLDPAGAREPNRETKTLPGFESEDPTSFFRKGEVGDWKRYFTPKASAWFKEAAGDILVRLGYEKTNNW